MEGAINQVKLYYASQMDSRPSTVRDFGYISLSWNGVEYVGTIPIGTLPPAGPPGYSEQYHLSRIGEGPSQLHGNVKALLPVARNGVRAGFPADHRALRRGYAAGSAAAFLPLIVAKAISTWADGARLRMGFDETP